jgi:hypothetical protein
MKKGKPVEMMFKRRLRDLLPEWDDGEEAKGPDEKTSTRQRRMMKYATGVQVNKKRGARDNSLEVGDVVFIKNKTRKGLEPRFSPTRFRIIEKGGTVIVKSDEGTVYKRCTNQVKKLTEKGNGD